MLVILTYIANDIIPKVYVVKSFTMK